MSSSSTVVPEGAAPPRPTGSIVRGLCCSCWYGSKLWLPSESMPHGNPCLQALIFLSSARTPLFISILFLSTGILQYANLAAGCTAVGNAVQYLNGTLFESHEVADEAALECDGMLWGGLMKPTSILTITNTISGLIICVMLPVAGAMVDYSNHRKGVILKSFMVFWVANLLQGFLNERTWILAIVLQSVFCVTTYMIHNTFVLSYYTEVVTDVEFQLPKLNATLRVYEMSGMLGFMILSTVVSRGAAMDIFATARFGQFFACALAVVPFFFGSKLLEERKAVHTRPEGLNLFTVGFAKVGKTMAMLNKDFHDCRNVLVAIMFFESANSNVVTTSTTYITQQLKIENPAPILTFIILMTIPGALICNRFVQKLGPLKACASCVALNMVTGAVTVLFVTSPETSGRIFITGALYGLGIGSTYPLQRNLFQSLMPFGHESELMGTLSFMGNIIGWLPSLLFSVLNEVTGNLRLAYAILPVFHGIGAAVLFFGVDEKRGREANKVTEVNRIKSRIGGVDTSRDVE